MSVVMSVPFEFSNASVYDIREVNSSFAIGTLKVMYLGKNRNGSHFNKEAVQKALPSLYNVPIVCHWDDENEEIGGHDMTVVSDKDGNLRLKTLTEPCGVVPDHAKFSFCKETDEGGEHTYLVIEGVILWKRQDVYSYIVNKCNGIVKHSMEITVNESHKTPDNYVDITDFEFTALCLLGNCEPCFEGSELEMFSTQNFKQKMEQMMLEIKENYNLINPSAEVVDTHPQYSMEGGETVLDNENKVVIPEDDKAIFETEEEKRKKAKIDDDDEEVTPTPTPTPDANQSGEQAGAQTGSQTGAQTGEQTGNQTGVQTGNQTGEQTGNQTGNQTGEQTGEQNGEQTETTTKTTTDPVTDPSGDGNNDPNNESEPEGYALTQNVVSEIEMELDKIVTETCWGETCRYIYIDCDFDLQEVYCYDINDWLLYGFKYTAEGDAIKIDFDSKKRKKFSIVDFDEGEQGASLAEFYSKIESETKGLKEFKANVEAQEAQAAREEILSKFADLNGNEEFEALAEKSAEFDCDTLLEKCYAIRGKNSTVEKVTFSAKAPKLCVETKQTEKEPYGDLFIKYGHKN